jgi:hypothetical protein
LDYKRLLIVLFSIEVKDLNNSNLKSYFLEEKTNSEEQINIYPQILKNIHINWQEGKLNWDKVWAVYTLEKWVAQNIK